MNKSPIAFFGALVSSLVISTTGCGSVDQASGVVATIQPVGPRAYATIPPVMAPPTTAPPAQPQPGEVTTVEVVHVVAANESLPLIAAAYQVDLAALAAHNSIEQNHVVNPGDRIRIPVGATMPTGPIAPATATPEESTESAGANESNDDTTSATDAPDNQGCTYTIVQGDNPTKVANKVGIGVTELKAANESSGVLENFLVGDKLVIPAPGSC